MAIVFGKRIFEKINNTTLTDIFPHEHELQRLRFASREGSVSAVEAGEGGD
jgi:hypothetical protein